MEPAATLGTPPPPDQPRGQSPGWGILWMVVTGLGFVAVTACVKMVGDAMPAVQAAFLRYALALGFLIPFIPMVRRVVLDRGTWMLFGIRGVLHSVAVILWFFAMARIPIADVTALNYLNPVYVIILAVLVLGERLGPLRIAAVGIAFVGTFIIIRPGFREVEIGHIAMLATAVFMAGSYFITKILSDRARPEVVVFMLSLVVPVALLPFAVAVWVPVSWVNLGWLFLCATIATMAHFTMTLAFRAAPLTVTQPVTFLQLIWATSLGVLVFGEPLDGYVVLGGGMIIASVSFITWREAVQRKRARAVPSAP